jgi:iron complex transport system substrate-binding protein
MIRNHITTLILSLLFIFTACTPSVSSEPTLIPEIEVDITPEPLPTATPEPISDLISIQDGMGRTIQLEAPAQNIISMAPSNMEILFAIGAGPQVVGRDEFSDYPPEAMGITSIGGGFGEYNLEVIASLQPDLILASFLQPHELIQSLEDLGFSVFVLPNPSEMEELFENLLVVGELTGNLSQAQSLVESLRERVADVEEKVSKLDVPLLVFYELDATEPNAPWTAGPGTFIDTIINMAGGVNLGSSLQGEWVQISIEEILIQDPDVIILGTYTWGGVTPEDVKARTGWEALSAVRLGRVYTIDDNLVSRPGPRMVEGLEQMARLLYPDLFD